MGATALWADVVKCLEGNPGCPKERLGEGVRCPGAPTAALPLLLWWAALDGDSRVLWLWHHGGRGEDAVGAGGNAARQGVGIVGVLATVPMLDAAAEVAPRKQCPHGLSVR